MVFSDIEDNELIYLHRNNNCQAKQYLIDRYKKRIYGMINKFANINGISKLDYEECYQDCFIVFLKCLDYYDGFNFLNYVTTAVFNKLYKILKRNQNYEEIISLDYSLLNDDTSLLDSVSDQEYNYEINDLRIFIEENFDSDYQKIIEYKLKGYSCLEISKILKINKKRVYACLEYIKNIFRKKWFNNANIGINN